MNVPGNSTFAWEPFTPRGVAAFAHARLGRLLIVQIIVALLAAASVAWFLHDSIFPIVRTAIANLPAAGEIRSARLDWRGDSPKLLAEGRFLALDVDLDHSGKINSTADVQIEFGREDVWPSALLGHAEIPYPSSVIISCNRTELEPLWGAWRAVILFLATAAAAIGLLASWWLLATLYFLPVWLLGFFVNRDLNFRRSWILSGAALLPGALLMAASILLYDFGAVDLVQFGFIFGAHFVLGWIYLFVSLPFVPGIPAAPPKNPFADKQ
jgi:type IV secretory pathway TrbD component